MEQEPKRLEWFERQEPGSWASAVPQQSSKRRPWAGVGLVAVGVVAGGILAGAVSANAATTNSGSTSTPASGYSSSAPGGEGGQHTRGNFPAHGTAAHEALEKPVTGDNATKAQAAAVKAVGSGSKAGAVTTDVSGNGYEVTVTKADGSSVEVHQNGSFGVDDHGRSGGGQG